MGHIVIIDYGMGNVRSVQKALEAVGGAATISAEHREIAAAAGVILPGVGAFGDAVMHLEELDLAPVIRSAVDRGAALLGICLGMQLLFESSDEMGSHRGLGVFPGKVSRLDTAQKLPHFGWNEIEVRLDNPLLADVESGAFAYFAHSYAVQPEDDALILATTDYEAVFPSIVGRDRVWGAQFHPEKSQDTGLVILRNFVNQL